MQVHGERCRKTTTCALRVASLLLSLPLWSVSAFIWFDQLSRIWHAYWYNCHACKSSSCISSLRLHVICTLPTRLFTMYITLHEALSTTTVTYKVWILLQQPLNGFFEFFFWKTRTNFKKNQKNRYRFAFCTTILVDTWSTAGVFLVEFTFNMKQLERLSIIHVSCRSRCYLQYTWKSIYFELDITNELSILPPS